MIKPTRLSLEKRTRLEATIREETDGIQVPMFVEGAIHVECSSAQAFAEILNYLVHADEAIIAVQTAISALQMAKGPAERVPDLRRLQDIHFRLTGWHFTSTSKPAPLERVPLKDGVPCSHRGCLSHVSHPCEGCGRIAGRAATLDNPEKEAIISAKEPSH